MDKLFMLKMNKKYLLFGIILVVLTSFILSTHLASAWWNIEYGLRREINLSTTNWTNKNFQVQMNITYDSDMQADFDDLRFVNGSDNALLPYFLQSKSNGAWANVWVKIDSNITTSNYTIYMYYGNDSVSSNSSANDTFIFYDDFSGSTLNTNKWGVSGGSVSVSGGYCNLSSSSSIYTIDILNQSGKIITRTLSTSESTGHYFGFTDSGNQIGSGYYSMYRQGSDTTPNWQGRTSSASGLDYIDLTSYDYALDNYTNYTLGWRKEVHNDFYINGIYLGDSAYAITNPSVKAGFRTGPENALSIDWIALAEYSPDAINYYIGPSSGAHVYLLSPADGSDAAISNQTFVCSATTPYDIADTYFYLWDSTNSLIAYQLMTPNSNAPTYQENANAINYSTGWKTPTNLYDGDWNTAASNDYAGTSYYYANYSKLVSSSAAIWQVKYGKHPTHGSTITIEQNYTIPNICFTPSTIQLKISSYLSSTPSGMINGSCYNGTEWQQLFSYSVGSTYTPYVYEEAMWWVSPADYSIDYVLPYEDTFKWNCNFTDVMGSSLMATDNFSLTYQPNVSILSTSYNTPVLEYSQQQFDITIEKSDNLTDITPLFVYNGTSYSTGITNVTTDTNITFSKTVEIPAVILEHWENKSFYWNFTISYGGNSHVQKSTSINQSVYRMIIQDDSSTGALNTINFTCYDDLTLAAINCTVGSTFKVWSPESYPTGSQRTYAFLDESNTSTKQYYKYPPAVSNFTSNISIYAYATGYPQKLYTYDNQNLGNISIEKPIYLTSTTGGIYVSFQVITTGGQVVSGAYITVTRQIGDTIVLITSGYTDSSGILTLFLNPNYSYIITTSKSGYNTQVTTVTPSQSLYTITLTSGSGYFYYNASLEGISWSSYPGSGILASNTTYNFTFTVHSIVNNIYNCSFYVNYPNGTLVAYVYGCNETLPNNGSTIWTNIDTTNMSTKLYGSYFITIYNSTTNSTQLIALEMDAQWVFVPVNPTGGNIFGTLKEFLSGLTNLPEWGTNAQTTDFNKIVFFFLFMAIAVAILNYFTGYDTAYPGSLLYLVTGIVIILSTFNGVRGIGFFYLSVLPESGYFGSFYNIINNWLLAVHFILLSLIYYFTNNRRYQSG